MWIHFSVISTVFRILAVGVDLQVFTEIQEEVDAGCVEFFNRIGGTKEELIINT